MTKFKRRASGDVQNISFSLSDLRKSTSQLPSSHTNDDSQSTTVPFSLSDLRSKFRAANCVVQSVSEDGRRLQTEETTIRIRRPSLSTGSPDTESNSLHEQPGLEDSSSSCGQGSKDEEKQKDGADKPRRPKYSSDWPFKNWIPFQDQFLDEMLRQEGRGSLPNNTCPLCYQPAVHSVGNRALYRCRDCFGAPHLCSQCLLTSHSWMPFHRPQVWNGTYHENVSLAQLGFQIQLSHQSPSPCPNPRLSHKQMSVIHTNGIHILPIVFCDCLNVAHAGNPLQQLLRYRLFPATVANPKTCMTFAALEMVHMQNDQAKCGLYDLYTVLERLSDNTGLSEISNLYKAFFRMLREWKQLKLVKRAGRGHSESGIKGTAQGELAVECPACPHPDINLPEDWESKPDNEKFLYFLHLSVDACFRCKRYDVSNTSSDPIIDEGWAYFVHHGMYMEEVKKYGSQKEISSCTGLSAIDHANTKFAQGYAVTGIGAAVCARHELIMGNGVGDLQKGEKYINMDLIYTSALRRHRRVKKLSCYDIVCQWLIHLFERIAALPPFYRIDISPNNALHWGIGKLHWHSHKETGHARYSLNYIPGAARSDGEGIERRWWDIQPIANSTKMMGPGAREGSLNDQWSYSNWRKVVGLGSLFCRKYITAVEEAAEQNADFTALSAARDPGVVAKWEADVKAWEGDITKPDPYAKAESGLSEAEIRRQLMAEEEALVRAGNKVLLHNISPVSFLISGLEIEEEQRQIAYGGARTGTEAQKRSFEQKTSLHRRIGRLREVQAVYMPGVPQKIATLASTSSPAVESIKLFLPSALSPAERRVGCTIGLAEIELRLREAQCREALEDLRTKLHMRESLRDYKRVNIRHQGPNTRANQVLSNHESKIKLVVEKYRAAWKAGCHLSEGELWNPEFLELKDVDIRALKDDDPKTAAKKQKKDGPAEGSRLISWIWRGGDTSNGSLYGDSLRLEWLKSRARKHRWDEEVLMLKEEVRRTIAWLRWKSGWWKERSNGRPGVDPSLQEGLRAYAHRQANIRARMATRFEAMWSKTLKKTTSNIVQGEPVVTASQTTLTCSAPTPVLSTNASELEDGDEDEDEDGAWNSREVKEHMQRQDYDAWLESDGDRLF